MQFIPSDVVEAARIRGVAPGLMDPVILGVDVARQGADQTVILVRKGRDARLFPMVKMREPDLMRVAAKVHDLATELRADAVFVDATGIGAGVFDRLRQLRLPGIVEVQFASKDDRTTFGEAPARYANKRASMWGAMREWLKGGGVPDDPELIADLTAVEFGHNARDEIQLEPKDALRKRGLASPDCGDALALTFAYPVTPSHLSGWPLILQERREYDPHGRV